MLMPFLRLCLCSKPSSYLQTADSTNDSDQGATIGLVMLTVSCAVMGLACCIIAWQRHSQRCDTAQMEVSKGAKKGTHVASTVRLQVPRDTNKRRAMLRQAFSELMTADTADVAAWCSEERCFTATRNGYTQNHGDIELLQQPYGGQQEPTKPRRATQRDSPSRKSFANHTPPHYHAAMKSPQDRDSYAACTRAPVSANYGAGLRRGQSRRENIDYAMAAALSSCGPPPRTPPRPSLRAGVSTPGARGRSVRFKAKSPLVDSAKAPQLAGRQRPEATYELVPSRRYSDEDVEPGYSLCKDRNSVSISHRSLAQGCYAFLAARHLSSSCLPACDLGGRRQGQRWRLLGWRVA